MSPSEQALVWDYFKPRHTHAWNMLVVSGEKLRDATDPLLGFEIEYHWENFILRLWLYRTAVKTLAKLPIVSDDALTGIKEFDAAFTKGGKNGLKALRDMIEHFDEYAAGVGQGPAVRENDLDPFRHFTSERYERGQFVLERDTALAAADKLRLSTTSVSAKFIKWHNQGGQ